MKIINKINNLVIVVFVLLTVSCSLDDATDLNGPSVDGIVENPTRGDIISLAQGIQSDMRIRLGTYYDDVGVIGREYYRFASSDPRFTGDLLGKNTSILDNNTFYTTGPWAARYKTVKSTNILIDAVNTHNADLTTDEENGTLGFAKTIQAYELLLNLNLQYQNGVRVDVTDVDNLGPFLSFDDSLIAIQSLLAEAAANLAGIVNSDFPFGLSEGFQTDFLEFNKAIAARISAYQGDYSAVLTHLGNSFFDLAGSINTGNSYVFENSGNDIANPVFFAQNSSAAGARIAHPTFFTDAEVGDFRLNKISIRDEPLTFDGLVGSYDFWVYKSNGDPIPIIRNEELILLYAEANMVTNPSLAVNAINKVRNDANIGNYSGGTSESELLEEILTQRRYSLYGEGHRWIDLRRFDKLSELPIDRPESVDDEGNLIEADDVWVQFPRPLTEN